MLFSSIPMSKAWPRVYPRWAAWPLSCLFWPAWPRVYSRWAVWPSSWICWTAWPTASPGWAAWPYPHSMTYSLRRLSVFELQLTQIEKREPLVYLNWTAWPPITQVEHLGPLATNLHRLNMGDFNIDRLPARPPAYSDWASWLKLFMAVQHDLQLR